MEDTSMWIPKTELGRNVMEGSIVSIDDIFAMGKKIKEPEIIDVLIPNLKTDVILIGGSPGKGGGIRRTPTKRTTRMHRSGRRFRTSAMVVVGNGDGYIGVGESTAADHRTAIRKATENAKLKIMPVMRKCGSWECACKENHSIPVMVEGKSGSVRVVLYPAPKGIGLCINDQAKKVLRLAGITDIWARSFGSTRTRTNYTRALFDAFRKINRIRLMKEKTKPEKKEVSEKAKKEDVKKKKSPKKKENGDKNKKSPEKGKIEE